MHWPYLIDSYFVVELIVTIYWLTGIYDKGEYLGCFRDNPAARDVGNFATTFRDENTPQKCIEICINGGMLISIIEHWLNPFIPKFLNWTLPSLNLDMSTDANKSFSLQSETEWQTVRL